MMMIIIIIIIIMIIIIPFSEFGRFEITNQTRPYSLFNQCYSVSIPCKCRKRLYIDYIRLYQTISDYIRLPMLCFACQENGREIVDADIP